MKVGDKVRSSKSLWPGDIGTISGFMVYSDNLVFVIFPENDKHYGYQQTLSKRDLILCEKS